MSKLIIVSNRLPVTVKQCEGVVQIAQSVGGLATGLASFYAERDCEWIGWPGLAADECSESDRKEIRNRLHEKHCEPVFLSERELDEYYRGFCNQTLWPLCHYFPSFAEYNETHWQTYRAVNERFCEAVVRRAGAGDTLWVHDYQLMLLPGMLRERIPDAAIGFFLHIPFPSSEVMRLLPWREEVLSQLLGADLIGFHTYDYVRHFLASVGGVLGHAPIAAGKTVIPVEQRLVRADAFPMGIDFNRYESLAQQGGTDREVERIQREVGENRRIILSVDRLDYSKGMLHRLNAFERFLEDHPEQRGKVTMVLKAIESRAGIAQYDRLKRHLDEAVGRVNGRFGTLDWVPIWYLFRYLPDETLIALYRLADVALLTPLRDGMNLIAKEFLAAKVSEDGVLVLSELAGAAQELQEALIINPNNEGQIAQAIADALEMNEDERSARCQVLRARVRDYDVVQWAVDFVNELEDIKALQVDLTTSRLRGAVREQLARKFREASSRLLVFDYDGTLVELAARPGEAVPPESLLQILGGLTNDPANEVTILSGRSREDMESWFSHLRAFLGAEHGVWTRSEDGRWERANWVTHEWKAEVQSVLELYARRTPGSRVEEKDYSLVWDYRNTKREFAEVRITELLTDLGPVLQSQVLDVLRGDGFIEVKSAGVSESKLVAERLSEREPRFVLCAGDDASDEEVFAALPDSAYSIRIGNVPSRARFSLGSSTELLELLAELVGCQVKGGAHSSGRDARSGTIGRQGA